MGCTTARIQQADEINEYVEDIEAEIPVSMDLKTAGVLVFYWVELWAVLLAVKRVGQEAALLVALLVVLLVVLLAALWVGY